MIRQFVLSIVLLLILFTFNVAGPRGTAEKERTAGVEYKSILPIFASPPSISLQPREETRETDFSADPFLQLPLEAESVYVLDLKDQKFLFAKDAFSPQPLASITKLLTALIAKEKIPEGLKVPVFADAIRQQGDSGFLDGESFKKDDLLDLMLVSSSNDAAYALAQYIGNGLEGTQSAAVSRFVALMNERARELGMLNASFLNPHGLDVQVNLKPIPGASASAFDVSLLMKYIFERHPDLMEKTREGEIKVVADDGRIFLAKNTNLALSNIPQLLGAKTGYTDLAGGNLVFIFDAGFSRPVLAVLLGSSESGRFRDAEKIVSAILDSRP